MKRNEQQKFRIKIIQEFHLNKFQQKRLDNCILNGILTYKEIYLYRNNIITLRQYYYLKKYSFAARNMKDLFILAVRKKLFQEVINDV